MKRIINAVLLFSLCLGLLPQRTLANGGPWERSDYIIGGNIRFADTPDILVEKEDLRITLSPRTSVVTAVYTLKNTGGERTLDYLFPISQYSSLVVDVINRSKLEWLAFYDGDKKLAYKKLSEPNDVPYSYKEESLGNIEFGYDELVNYYYSTKLSFAPNETKTLTVTYKVTNAFTIWPGELPYLYSEWSAVSFLYDLSPAAA